jgi:hypothetical protein
MADNARENKESTCWKWVKICPASLQLKIGRAVQVLIESASLAFETHSGSGKETGDWFVAVGTISTNYLEGQNACAGKEIKVVKVVKRVWRGGETPLNPQVQNLDREIFFGGFFLALAGYHTKCRGLIFCHHIMTQQPQPDLSFFSDI